MGVLQGTRTYLLQDAAGNVLPTHSVSAGLDYPAVGPEHALLHDEGRVEYASVSDEEALAAFHLLGETEGVLPALESSHAVAWLLREAGTLHGRTVIVNMSGRGDKDLGILESEATRRKPRNPGGSGGIGVPPRTRTLGNRLGFDARNVPTLFAHPGTRTVPGRT